MTAPTSPVTASRESVAKISSSKDSSNTFILVIGVPFLLRDLQTIMLVLQWINVRLYFIVV